MMESFNFLNDYLTKTRRAVILVELKFLLIQFIRAYQISWSLGF